MNAFGKEYHSWILNEPVSQSVLHQVLNEDSDGVFKGNV